MKDFVLNNPTFSVLLLLFVIEQVFYYVMGSYPYRYGVPVKKLPLPSATEILGTSERNEITSLAVKVSAGRAEMYFRDRNLFGTIGPLFFLGQITIDNGGTAVIRIGPLTCVFMVFLILSSYNDIISGALIVLFLIWMYYRLFRKYQKFIEQRQSKQSEAQPGRCT